MSYPPIPATPEQERAARLACSGCWPQDDLPPHVPCVCGCHDHIDPAVLAAAEAA